MYIADALDELESWLWHHYPDVFARSEPGLTDQEIDAAFDKISLIPSAEIREMYKWYNGTNYLFDSPYYQVDWGIGCMSLDYAVKNTLEFDWMAKQININNMFCPFPDMECAMHFFVCDDERISPILAVDEDFSPRITWTSLTSMVLTHLKAYQQGVLTLEGYHSEDKTRLAVRRSIDFDKQFQIICARHNSESEMVKISEKYNIRQ